MFKRITFLFILVFVTRVSGQGLVTPDWHNVNLPKDSTHRAVIDKANMFAEEGFKEYRVVLTITPYAASETFTAVSELVVVGYNCATKESRAMRVLFYDAKDNTLPADKVWRSIDGSPATDIVATVRLYACASPALVTDLENYNGDLIAFNTQAAAWATTNDALIRERETLKIQLDAHNANQCRESSPGARNCDGYEAEATALNAHLADYNQRQAANLERRGYLTGVKDSLNHRLDELNKRIDAEIK